MRRGTLITLGASIVFGGLAIVLARGFIYSSLESQLKQSKLEENTKAQLVKHIETVSILVADTSIAMGDIMTAQHVHIVEFPVSSVPEGSYYNYNQLFPEDMDGQIVALSQMAAGEPVLSFKVSKPGGRLTLSSLISPNMSAVSIKVDAVSGVAGFIQPGDRVDVAYTRSEEAKKGSSKKKNVIALMIAQNVLVLGADQRIDTIANTVQVGKTITLEVSPEQAQKIALAKVTGKLSLSLRGIEKQEITAVRQLEVSDLKSERSKTRNARVRVKRAKPRSETARITIVRNGEPNQVSVFKEPEKELQMAGGSL